jgi:hypothetical protein
MTVTVDEFPEAWVPDFRNQRFLIMFKLEAALGRDYDHPLMGSLPLDKAFLIQI